MGKYNLTFWQRAGLPLLYIHWLMVPKNKRKSWHLVKKGMEPHKHNFTIPRKINGYVFYQCDHEGCTLLTDLD